MGRGGPQVLAGARWRLLALAGACPSWGARLDSADTRSFMAGPLPLSPPSRAPRPKARTAAARTWRLGAAALAALLPAACDYPDVALTPPERAPAAPTAILAEPADQRGEFGLGTPFVVIRFGPEPVDFEEPLASAVAAALAQRPNAKFHLLAVTASGGPHLARAPSLRHAEAVLRSLAAMGVPPGEVFVAAVASPASPFDEVRLYLR